MFMWGVKEQCHFDQMSALHSVILLVKSKGRNSSYCFFISGLEFSFSLFITLFPPFLL